MKSLVSKIQRFALVPALLVAAFVATGCATKGGSSGSGSGDYTGIGLGTLARVYFDYDQASFTAEARDTLKKNAAVMKKSPSMRVLVEGHCDERGTNEYNIALGERRAKATLDYLVSLGIARSRLEMKSWGEERPLDTGKNDSAYGKNRRAEFVVLAK